MAYVIAETCVSAKDTACVDVCPVDCIHPRKDEAEFASAPQFYAAISQTAAAGFRPMR
jgi:ferredoxin